LNTKAIRGLLGLSAVMMLAALYLIFIFVPTEADMGIVQRIFYFHIPLAWLAFLAFFIVFLGSVLYLTKRDNKWDRLASSSAQIGVMFTTLFLIAGSLWAKPIWGVWWTWDPRLTSSLVLWVIYIAYLLVRSYAASSEQGARFGAVIGIVGFLDVPIVLWRLFVEDIAPQSGHLHRRAGAFNASDSDCKYSCFYRIIFPSSVSQAINQEHGS
jgi:heme exporter protein C